MDDLPDDNQTLVALGTLDSGVAESYVPVSEQAKWMISQFGFNAEESEERFGRFLALLAEEEVHQASGDALDEAERATGDGEDA